MIIEEIRTIDELLQFVNGLHQKHGLRLWYRGVDDASLSLVPSIQRSEKRLEKERYITNDFYIRAKQILNNPPEKHNYAAWVSIMQHYGLPTRMLDWSQSPLIASFFASETYQTTYDMDAGIWILAPDILNEQEGFGRCIFPIDADTSRKCCCPLSSTRTTIRLWWTKFLPVTPRRKTCVCTTSRQALPSTIPCAA